MIIDYSGLKFFIFPINLIIEMTLFIGFCQLNKNLIQYLKLKDKKYIELFFPFFLFNILAIFPFIFLLINFQLFKVSIYLIFVVLFIFFIVCFKKFKFNFFFKKKLQFNLNNILISLFFLTYLILSFLPLSDADSLSYHYAFGSYVLKNQSLDWLYNAQEYNVEFLVASYNEIINLFGQVLMLENFGSFINFATFIYIFYCTKKIFWNQKNLATNYLFILTSPILIPIIFSQKIYILPSFVLSLIIYFFYKNPKIENIDRLILTGSLIGLIGFKLSFLYPVIFIFFYWFYIDLKKNLFIKNLSFAFLAFGIFYFPIILKNFIYHSDFIPPFTGKLLGLNDDYLNSYATFLQNYDLNLSIINFLFLPFLFLIPHYGVNGMFYFNFYNVGKVLGLQFYGFLFGNRKFDLKIFLILLLITISVIITGNISTRWFLPLFFIIIYFCLEKKMIYKKYFLNIFYVQTLILVSFLVLFCLMNLQNIFSFKKRDEFLNLNSNGYNFVNKINFIKTQKKLKPDEHVLYSHRSQFWTDIKNNHLNLSNEFYPLFKITNGKLTINKKFKKIVKNKNIKIFILRYGNQFDQILNNSIKNQLSCTFEIGEFYANHASRIKFFSGKKRYIWVKFKNSNLNNCLSFD